MSDVDISNMGRCVVCGGTVDMRDDRDDLVVMEHDDPDETGFSIQEQREAIARALRYYDAPENHTLAQAYEDGDEIVLHGDCYDKTALPDIVEEAAHDPE